MRRYIVRYTSGPGHTGIYGPFATLAEAQRARAEVASRNGVDAAWICNWD